jgi:hypothetical protein
LELIGEAMFKGTGEPSFSSRVREGISLEVGAESVETANSDVWFCAASACIDSKAARETEIRILALSFLFFMVFLLSICLFISKLS